jgi:hypothetical protein
MKNTTTNLGRALAVYLVALVLVLVSCKKNENCQQDYDSIRTEYYRKEKNILSLTNLPEAEIRERLNQAARDANQAAAAKDGCCCWSKLNENN